MITASPEITRSKHESQKKVKALTGFYIFPFTETTGISDDALAGKEIISARCRRGPAGAHAQRSNAIGVTERDDAKASKHCNAGIGTLCLLEETSNSCENILFIDSEFPRLLEIVGEDIQEQFGIGRSVDVTMRLSIQEV